jgi:hypothetical protein
VNMAARRRTRRAAAREVERKLKTHASASALDYLLHEPPHARRQRQMDITICTVALIAIAGVLHG